MNIYVLDKQLNRVGIVDTFSSIIWTNRYYSYGDFQLDLPATNKNINLLQHGFYLVRESQESNAMIIEAIQLTTDVETGNMMTVVGGCLKSILHRRIVWQMTHVVGRLETCIARLLNDNAISPSSDARRFANLINGNMLTTDITINAQYTGDNLGEVITALCTNYGLGWDITVDIYNKRFVFILYKGQDRSYSQTINPWVVFSNEYENLLTTTYTNDTTDYKNVAKVAGEGEGLLRKYTTVGNASDVDRYELYVDAKDLSTNDGEISDIDYYAQLSVKGNEALSETQASKNFEGEVEANYTYKYGEDYFLGDVVEVINEYGMAASTRIIEVIESEDDGGSYVIPTFSDYISQEV